MGLADRLERALKKRVCMLQVHALLCLGERDDAEVEHEHAAK